MRKFLLNAALSLTAIALSLLLLEWGPILFRLPPVPRVPRLALPGWNLNPIPPFLCDEPFTKAPGQKIAVTLGGSSAYGWPHGPSVAFSAKAERWLSPRLKGGIRFLNKAASAMDSYYMLRCAEFFAKRPVDYFILYDGHNDFINLGMNHPALSIFLYDHPRLLMRLQQFYDESPAMNWLSLVKRSPDDMPNWKLSPAAFERAKGLIINKFMEHVDGIAAIAKADGAKFILVTSVSNLFDTSPYQDLAGPPDLIASAHYHEGKKLYEGGRYPEALAELRRAKDLDAQGVRAYSDLNEAIRAYAAAHPEVLLVDFERILEAQAPNGRIGCNYFGDKSYCDHLHPNEATHELMGRAIGEKILDQEKGRAKASAL
ncbi:MAG: hypothetical protein ACXVB9_01785 [Bdellovibrionota bacterium]